MPTIEKVFIKDLETGQTIISPFVARNKQLRGFRDKTGQYLSFQLVDRTGNIEARVWEEAEATAALFEDGDAVLVKAVVEEYQGSQQLRVEKIRKARDEEYQRQDLVPSTPKDLRELYNEVRTNLERVQNPHLQQLLQAFFSDREFVRAFIGAAGARQIHHAYRGGLLEHVVHCLRLANVVCDNYPELNRDLLLTGVLLHDIGKIDELDNELSLEFTLGGRFTGHLCLSYQRVMAQIAALPDFPEDLAMIVANMILGHHGRGEFGSPMMPKTVEAEVLHHLENLDAQASRWLTQIAKDRPTGKAWGEFLDHGLRREVYLKTPEALGLLLPDSPDPEAEG